MAKDYFQDILPPDESPKRRARRAEAPEGRHIPIRTPHEEAPEETTAEPDEQNAQDGEESESRTERSIRNIAVPERRRPVQHESASYMISPPRRSGGRWLLWLAAGGSLVVLVLLALVALRSTSVTVTPRTQAVTFDSNSQFSAYPSASAASGALAYDTRSVDLDDSEVVSSTGTVHASDKASGTITVYNNFSNSTLKFVATTRFQSANGMIFRTPAAIVVPGKTASGPGTVTVTVVADQPGEQYNVPAGKFTIPGLKGSAEYAQVYAMSSTAMAGGFLGDKPGVDESTMAAAKAAIRGRLESKARDSIASENGALVLPDLVQIQYQDEAPTPEAGNQVRIHETAHVTIPSFSPEAFAAAVASSVGVADTPLTFVPGTGFAANISNTSSTLGQGPLQFTLSGSGTLVWTVDAAALQKALAGKPQSAFQDVVKQFTGIQTAHARVEPFWSSVFPTDPKAIKVSVQQVGGAQ